VAWGDKLLALGPDHRPFRQMMRFLGHTAIIVLLTLLTQLGGLAWLFALLFRRRIFMFVLTYSALTLAAHWATPVTGRMALSCHNDGSLQVQSWFYCITNRNYVTPELAAVLQEAAATVEREYPGTKTRVLDANFPFLTGFPLLPHLSHDDGEKVDLAFFYRDASGYLAGVTRSPIGYFAFEDDSRALAGDVQNCPEGWLTLRWDFAVLQRFWPEYVLEPKRTALLLRTLVQDTRVAKLFLEPHLQRSLGVEAQKIRFQGCRAARHDDHIHLQL
jgi:hypothetical protein